MYGEVSSCSVGANIRNEWCIDPLYAFWGLRETVHSKKKKNNCVFVCVHVRLGCFCPISLITYITDYQQILSVQWNGVSVYGRDVKAVIEQPLEEEPMHPGRNTVSYESRLLKSLLLQLN